MVRRSGMRGDVTTEDGVSLLRTKSGRVRATRGRSRSVTSLAWSRTSVEE